MTSRRSSRSGRGHLLDYYEPLGDAAHTIAGSLLGSPEAVQGTIAAFADIGIDELILDPTVSDPEQVDRLAGVAL